MKSRQKETGKRNTSLHSGDNLFYEFNVSGDVRVYIPLAIELYWRTEITPNGDVSFEQLPIYGNVSDRFLEDDFRLTTPAPVRQDVEQQLCSLQKSFNNYSAAEGKKSVKDRQRLGMLMVYFAHLTNFTRGFYTSVVAIDDVYRTCTTFAQKKEEAKK